MNIKQPNRRKHAYSQQLNAPPKIVFPLLCPVMEAKWVPGWMPELVISQSGVCEQDCMFITPAESPLEPEASIWIVTKYDTANWSLEMYKVTPGHTVSKLEITLADDAASSTTAQISYEITVLGTAGEQFMEGFTEKWYEDFMTEWEKQMNYYLDTGNKIA